VFCLGALAAVSVVQVSAATFLHYRLYAANQALSAAAGTAGGVDALIMAAVITTLITIVVGAGTLLWAGLFVRGCSSRARWWSRCRIWRNA